MFALRKSVCAKLAVAVAALAVPGPIGTTAVAIEKTRTDQKDSNLTAVPEAKHEVDGVSEEIIALLHKHGEKAKDDSVSEKKIIALLRKHGEKADATRPGAVTDKVKRGLLKGLIGLLALDEIKVSAEFLMMLGVIIGGAFESAF